MKTRYTKAKYNRDGWYEITPIHQRPDGSMYSYEDQTETALDFDDAKQIAERIARHWQEDCTVRIRKICEVGFVNAIPKIAESAL